MGEGMGTWRACFPVNSVCLPLSYSGNPGVNDVSYRGGCMACLLVDQAASDGDEKTAQAQYRRLVACHPCEIHRLPLDSHCNSGVTRQY